MKEVVSPELVTAIVSAAEEAANIVGLQLLRVNFRGTKSKPIIEVTLDGDRLVTITDCESVSRSLKDSIESLPHLSENYRLDVFSPGIDEELVHMYQFQRSVGRLLEMTLASDMKVKGYLRYIEDNTLTIEDAKNKNEQIAIQLSDITKAKVLIDFRKR